VCARALALCFVCLRGRRFWALPACLPDCSARSQPHHAPARRTKLTTDSRLLSLSQESIAYEKICLQVRTNQLYTGTLEKYPTTFSYDA
jgi:hypothetical protein